MPQEYIPACELRSTFKQFEFIKLLLDLHLPERLISETLQYYPMPNDPIRSDN